jgi:hypothetical protein
MALGSRIPYFRDAVAGRTKPHVFSWLVWTITMGVVAGAQIAGGAGPGAWAALCAAGSNLAILVVAVRNHDFQATALDWFSLGMCGFAGSGGPSQASPWLLF